MFTLLSSQYLKSIDFAFCLRFPCRERADNRLQGADIITIDINLVVCLDKLIFQINNSILKQINRIIDNKICRIDVVLQISLQSAIRSCIIIDFIKKNLNIILRILKLGNRRCKIGRACLRINYVFKINDIRANRIESRRIIIAADRNDIVGFTIVKINGVGIQNTHRGLDNLNNASADYNFLNRYGLIGIANHVYACIHLNQLRTVIITVSTGQESLDIAMIENCVCSTCVVTGFDKTGFDTAVDLQAIAGSGSSAGCHNSAADDFCKFTGINTCAVLINVAADGCYGTALNIERIARRDTVASITRAGSSVNVTGSSKRTVIDYDTISVQAQALARSHNRLCIYGAAIHFERTLNLDTNAVSIIGNTAACSYRAAIDNHFIINVDTNAIAICTGIANSGKRTAVDRYPAAGQCLGSVAAGACIDLYGTVFQYKGTGRADVDTGRQLTDNIVMRSDQLTRAANCQLSIRHIDTVSGAVHNIFRTVCQHDGDISHDVNTFIYARTRINIQSVQCKRQFIANFFQLGVIVT